MTTATATETMQDVALRLLEKGYVPLRLDPDSKAARHQGWQIETPTEESVRRAFARTSNLGVRCGDLHKDGTCLIGIDVDLEEGELIRCVTRAIGEDVPVKKGKKGATFIFRLDREHKTTKIKWVRNKKKTDAIDILCKGAQTVLPPSIHPDTKLPYQYISGPKLEDTDYRTLPVFGPSVIDEIRGFCANPDDPIYALNDMVWAGVGGGGNTHDTCVRAVSSMVARKWTDEDIHQRIQRAKREACEAAGMAYNWPESQKVIQEWINSSRDKKFDTTSKVKIDDIPMELINDYVYVSNIDRMYNIKKGTMVGMNVFNNVHARELKNPWVNVLMHPDFRIVDKVTYFPGQPLFCREKSLETDAVLDCVNIWKPSGVEPNDGDVEPYLDLVRHVFDHDEGAIRHYLSFFAYLVQNPGSKVNHGLVIQGEQGIGKDSILLAMNKVFGEHNCTQVELQQLESQFNDWLFGKQLIVFPEMMAAGRKGIYNKLKPYITAPYHSINVKNVSIQRIANRSVLVFLTNYKYALSIDPGDRRVWVWYSKASVKPASYFKQYYSWLADDRSAGALLQFLLNYDLAGFNPDQAPPMTASKRELIETSASEIEQFLRQAAEAGTWPMGCDLVNVAHLNGALRPMFRAGLNMITEALENIAPNGAIETRPRVGNARPRLRAIRNFDKWKEASAEELAKHYRMPLPPGQGETEGTYQVYGGSDLGGDTPDEQF